MANVNIEKGTRKIIEVCANVQENDNVLIVTDTGIGYNIAESLFEVANSYGAKVAIILTEPSRKPGEEPTKLVAAAMKAADVIISPTTRTIFHSNATTEALQAGARLLSLTEVSEDILVSGGIDADFYALQSRINRVKDKIEKGKKVKVTTKNGTDITLDITGRPAYACTGLCHKSGQKIGIPELEVFVAPLEELTNGTLVVDVCISGVGEVKEPVVITIKNGKMEHIEGGIESEKLRALLDDSKDSACYVIAEFALGLNDKAKAIGKIIEDEGVYGTGHFAFGNNIHFGGINQAAIHLDMVYWHPTVEIDGEIIMEDGKLISILE